MQKCFKIIFWIPGKKVPVKRNGKGGEKNGNKHGDPSKENEPLIGNKFTNVHFSVSNGKHSGDGEAGLRWCALLGV